MTPRRLQWGGNPNPVKPAQPQGGKASKGGAQPPSAASKPEQPSTATLVDRSAEPAVPAMLGSGLGSQADVAPMQTQLPAETQRQQESSTSSQTQSQPPAQQSGATHLPIFASTQPTESGSSAQSSASASGTATPQRPGLGNVGRQSTTYGVSGLSSLSKAASNLIYGED